MECESAFGLGLNAEAFVVDFEGLLLELANRSTTEAVRQIALVCGPLSRTAQIDRGR